MGRALATNLAGGFVAGIGVMAMGRGEWWTAALAMLLAAFLVAYEHLARGSFDAGWEAAVGQYDVMLAGRIEEIDRSELYCTMVRGTVSADEAAQLDLLENPSLEDLAEALRRHRRLG